MSSQVEYNRERTAMDRWAKRDLEATQLIEAVHQEWIGQIQQKIDSYYMRYASREGLTRAEAHKVIQGFDVPAWAERAAKAVRHKDFSPYTNRWLKKYNTKMYISRLEHMKADLELALMQMHSSDHAIIDRHLIREYLAEAQRQSGILAGSARGAPERARRVVNADFYGKNFSERIWGRTGYFHENRKAVFSALNQFYVDMDGYRKVRAKLMQKFKVTEYEAMRLLRTETGRIRAQAQLDKYEEHTFTHYRYVAEPGACHICADLDQKTFKVQDAVMGENFPVMHPNCKCSTYGIIEMVRKDGSSNLD